MLWISTSETKTHAWVLSIPQIGNLAIGNLVVQQLFYRHQAGYLGLRDGQTSGLYWNLQGYLPWWSELGR